MNINPVDQSSYHNVLRFLEQHTPHCMFLLENITQRGYALSDHPHSGNFWYMLDDSQIVGVFSLTREGILVNGIFVPLDDTTVADILTICKKESANGIHVTGVVGTGESSARLTEAFINQWHMRFDREELETLLSCSLSSIATLSLEPPYLARLLTEDDFEQWIEARIAYNLELNLGNPDRADPILAKRFDHFVANEIIWGIFESDTLIATANCSALYGSTHQIGGVYTLPAYRGQGFAKHLMEHILQDSAERHGHTQSILFTDNDPNSAPQRLYRSLGYREIGQFSLNLGGKYVGAESTTRDNRVIVHP